MAFSSHVQGRPAPGASVPAAWGLAALGATAIGAGLVMPHPRAGVVLFAAGATLAMLALVLMWRARHGARATRQLHARLAGVVGADAAPCFGTDAEGRIRYRNAAARARFDAPEGRPMSDALGEHFASPSAMLRRLQSRAERHGAAQEDLRARRWRVRVSAHRLEPGGFLWRIDEIDEPGNGAGDAETPSLPMLRAAPDGSIIFANAELRELVGAPVETLDTLFSRPPRQGGGTAEIATHAGPAAVTVAESPGDGERRDLYVLPAADANAPDPAATDFESLPVALVRLTPDGRVARANREARALLDLTDGAEARFADLVEGLGRPVADWLRDATAGRAVDRPEILHASRPDPERFVQVTLRRVGAHGHSELMAVLSDATELKSLEAKFVQSQKMHAIGQLAGGVAHDFNNLLTAISGHCDLLLLRHREDDPDYPDLVQIHHNTNRAAGLVGQLLAFSRKQTHKPELLDLHDTLSDLTHLLNRLVGERVTLVLDPAPDLPHLRADKRQFEQVMMNLVVNARDAMPDGGEVRITAAPLTLEDELRRDRARVPPGDYVLVTVTDEGTGISEDKLQKVFEPFYSTKPTGEGTGLGLSTVYGIMKQSGGFVFVDSSPGSGATFTLFFPAHAAPVDAESGRPAVTETALDGDGVVLLVEDEAPVRAFAARALRLRGYTVLEADSGEAALEQLDDATLHVDLVVTDVIMPGMDGPSWVREALRARPDTRIVFVSGHPEDSFVETQREIPNSVFLPKPFSLDDLTRTVQAQLAHN